MENAETLGQALGKVVIHLDPLSLPKVLEIFQQNLESQDSKYKKPIKLSVILALTEMMLHSKLSSQQLDSLCKDILSEILSTPNRFGRFERDAAAGTN